MLQHWLIWRSSRAEFSRNREQRSRRKAITKPDRNSEETRVAALVISATARNVIPILKATKRDDAELTLVQRAQQGDEEAFATLFELHKRRVYSVCLRMTKEVTAAEDLTQESFLQVFRNIWSFRGSSPFSTWLHPVTPPTLLITLPPPTSPSLLS